MSAMIIDAAKVNSLVIPNLAKTKTNLEESYKISNTLLNKLPSSASSRNRLSEIIKRINTAGKNINTISIKLDNKIEKAKAIEKKNKAKTTAISAAVGAVAGVAGAAIGAATGGIKGAVVGGAVAAAGAVVATKAVTSVGKALKNTGAKVAKSVGNFFSSVWSGIKSIGKSIVNACKKIANKVVSFVKEKISPLLKSIWSGIKKFGMAVFKTVATITTLAVSLVEGVVSFVEAIGDVVLIVVGGVCSVVTALADVVRGVCTGEWDFKCTKAVWTKWIMPWVGYDWTSKIFDYAAPVLALGMDKYAADWAKRGAMGYKIGKGVGYVVGIVVASVFTAGAAGAVAGAGSGVAGGITAVSSLVGGSAAVAAGVSASTALAAATVTSTAMAGAAKFGQEAQKGYNSLSDEEKQNMGSIGKVLGASAIKGGVEAATWYVTYGGAGKAMAGATEAAVKAGAQVTLKTKVVTAIGKTATNTWGKAVIQAGKEFINEGANSIITGKYNLDSAITGAVVSAGTSIIYDKTIAFFMKNNTIEARTKAAEEAAKNAPKISADQAFETATSTSTVKQLAGSLLDKAKQIGGKALDKLDPLLRYASGDAGGKKIIGGGIKSTIKKVIEPIVKPVVTAVAEGGA